MLISATEVVGPSRICSGKGSKKTTSAKVSIEFFVRSHLRSAVISSGPWWAVDLVCNRQERRAAGGPLPLRACPTGQSKGVWDTGELETIG